MLFTLSKALLSLLHNQELAPDFFKGYVAKIPHGDTYLSRSSQLVTNLINYFKIPEHCILTRRGELAENHKRSMAFSVVNSQETVLGYSYT